MTSQMVLVLSILCVSILFLVTEWIPMEVTALLVLATVALTGLVSPKEALSGFSNPAVITVWTVFIISGGLTRTGVANVIGRLLLRLSGQSRLWMVVLIMLSAGGLSAIMNNVAVAALLLPVVMDIAHQTRQSPSKLLMPLAYGSLLGGLTTLIGTPPNLLVSEALRDAGLAPFGLLDFTPVGACVMVAGTLYMVFIGTRLLPEKAPASHSDRSGTADLEATYHLLQHMFYLKVPPGSPLVGKSLTDTRLGSMLGFHVVGINRKDHSVPAPGPSERLQGEDLLVVEGPPEEIETIKKELRNWSELRVMDSRASLAQIFSDESRFAEATVSEGSAVSGKNLVEIGFRERFGMNVLAIRSGQQVNRAYLGKFRLGAGDRLLVQGSPQNISLLAGSAEFCDIHDIDMERLTEDYFLDEGLLSLQVPPSTFFKDKTLRDTRLGNFLGAVVLAIQRGAEMIRMPDPNIALKPKDVLLVAGQMEALLLVQSLGELTVDPIPVGSSGWIESESVGIFEVMLSPHGRLAGKSLREIGFREKFGLTVLAVWREATAHRSEKLADMPLKFGDALLVHGPREKFKLLAREIDFIVLTQSVQEPPIVGKAPISVLITVGVLAPVFMGWVPIYIATIVGAAAMVICKCLSMSEAYRSIEWKAVFLIAGMLPLGDALANTGTASYLAEHLLATVGGLGPIAVMAGLMGLTFMATCVIPTAALVVLMAPIVLNTAADLGVSPYAFMMAVAIAASASFMTPISHPANLMVMGPGGYRFTDYLKAGIPLTVIVWIVALLVLPVFWPLFP